MQFSGFQIVGFVLLLAGVGLVAVGLGTDYWSSSTFSHRGLWRSCVGASKGIEEDIKNTQADPTESGKIGCINRFSGLFKSWSEADKSLNSLSDLELAVFSMMLIAGVIGLLALVTSPCCCNRCGGLLASFVFLAFLSGAGAICTYAWFAKKENDYDFGWSYWVSLGGVGALLLAEIFFGVSRARMRYSEYSHAI